MWFLPEAITVACDDRLDESLEAVHTGAAVFAVWPREGEPYLGKTGVLRRRLKRLLRRREGLSRILNLRDVAERIEYWPVGSRLDASLGLYSLARQHLPDGYIEFLKLRMPPFVKLVLSNPFPRTHVTTRLTGGSGQFYGPFRSRASAEQFEHQVLDLFQLRRCQEELAPTPDHPGCVYGEMNMCLRPCQEVVSIAEYASETARVSEFLRTNGAPALHAAEAARDRASGELDFEEAARQHKRVERIQELLKLRDDLARDVEALNGVAITPAVHEGSVNLWFLSSGAWHEPVPFDVANTDQSVSMDKRLRDLTSALATLAPSVGERQEHLAILARWFYSSWRDGAWIEFDRLDRIPYRRMVSAISRTVHQSSPAAST